MNCDQCGTPLNESETNEHLGQQLCDDCCMDARTPVKTCDPWASYSAHQFETNHKSPPQLTLLQTRIVDIVTCEGEIEPEDLLVRLEGQLTRPELERQFATLKHMGKLGARKAGENIYLTTG